MKYIDLLNVFFRDSGLKVEPFPKIFMDLMQHINLDMNNGIYIPSEYLIILNIRGRHIQDILRTYCHELIHHEQNIKNPGSTNYMSNKLDSIGIINIEKDAYIRGNILFDIWLNKNNPHVK